MYSFSTFLDRVRKRCAGVCKLIINHGAIQEAYLNKGTRLVGNIRLILKSNLL